MLTLTCANGAMNCGYPSCGCAPKVNALGEPSPGRTDFSKWQRETLEHFARTAADENLVLRTQLAQAQDDLAVALAGWRRAAADGADQ